jgi:hypothetical protein
MIFDPTSPGMLDDPYPVPTISATRAPTFTPTHRQA